MLDLSVVIPAYNEEKRIKPTLKSIGRFISKSNINTEVIVVVNNTTDNTVGVVNNISKIYPFISVIDVKGYTGKGGAIAIGVKKAKGKYIAYLDADGSANIKDLITGYEKLKNNNNLDIVIGSRYMKGSNISGSLPIYRFVLSRIFNLVVKFFLNLNFADTQCAVKIFKKSVAKTLFKTLKTKKWTIDVNLLLDAKINNFNVLEYPITWIFKDGSKLKFFDTTLSVIEEITVLKIYDIYSSLKKYITKVNIFRKELEVID